MLEADKQDAVHARGTDAKQLKRRRPLWVPMLMFISLTTAIGMFVGSLLADECPDQMAEVSSILAKAMESQAEPQAQDQLLEATDGKPPHERLVSVVVACGAAVARPEAMQKHGKRLVDALVSIYEGLSPLALFLGTSIRDVMIYLVSEATKFGKLIANIDYAQLARDIWTHPITQAAASIPPAYKALGGGFLLVFLILWRLLGFRRSLVWTSVAGGAVYASLDPQVQQCASEAYFITSYLAKEFVSCVSSRGTQCGFISAAADDGGNPPQITLWIKSIRAWLSTLRQQAVHLQVNS
jgi:hypothetical protein